MYLHSSKNTFKYFFTHFIKKINWFYWQASTVRTFFGNSIIMKNCIDFTLEILLDNIMKYIKPSLIIFIINTNKKQFFKISNFWRFVSFIRILLVFVYLLQTYFCIYYFCILFLLVCFFWKISVSILCLFLQPSYDPFLLLLYHSQNKKKNYKFFYVL